MTTTDVNSTITNIKNDTAATRAAQKAANGNKTELDQDAFLQLLMAQMQNQDPTNPTDNSQFLTQTAQFTQVSEMQKLNQSNSFAQASDLIGKTVTLTDADNNNAEVKGIVTEAKITSTGTSVVIGGKEYSTKYITGVKATEAAASNSTSTSSTTQDTTSNDATDATSSS